MRLLLGFALIVAAWNLTILAYNQIWDLQFEINRGLQPDQQFEPLFWSLSARRRSREVQKRVLPDSSRLKRSYLFGLAGLALCFAGAAVLKLLILE